jgi:hypothetical protein
LRYILKHYTLSQILDDFVPAEADYLVQHPILSETNALRLVYFEMAIPRPSISPNATAKEVTAVQTALLHLRRKTITTLVKNQPVPASLTEFEFPDTGSAIGWLTSQLRRAWSSIAAKWLVRSLTQQQNEHNRYFLRRIEHLNNQTEIQAHETERLLAELLSAQQKQRELEAELADLRARHSQLATGVTRPS